MELKLTVTGADFGLELAGILDSLTLEEKKELAKEVLLKTLNEVTDSQRTLAEKELSVFDKLIKDIGSYHKEEHQTDGEWDHNKLRKHYKYNDLMRNTKSVKELAIESILSIAKMTFEENVKNLVNNDEGLKEMWTIASEEIKKNFPAFVHDAMMFYFTSQLNTMGTMIQNSLLQSGNNQGMLQQIMERMNQRH